MESRQRQPFNHPVSTACVDLLRFRYIPLCLLKDSFHFILLHLQYEHDQLIGKHEPTTAARTTKLNQNDAKHINRPYG